MRPLPMLLLLAGCASASARAGAEDAACEQHVDCGRNLLCEDESETCQRDECVSDDDCDASRLGEARCQTLDGVVYASTCAYDGDRCLEWSPEACEPSQTCQVTDGVAACEDPVEPESEAPASAE